MAEAQARASQELRRRVVDGLAVWAKLKHRYRRPHPDEQEIGRQRTAFYEHVWREAAEALGGTVRSVDGSLLEVSAGGHRLLVQKNVTSLDDPITVRLSMDKGLVHRLLRASHIPVPRSFSCHFDDVAGAWDFVVGVSGPCVVKPATLGIGGLGVTTAVCTRRQLMTAMALGRVYDRELLVEEQVEGGVYRLLYLDGELLDAVLRSPPAVVGDGRATVEQLIARENARRSRIGSEAAQAHIRIDGDLRQTLRAADLDLRSVPAAGATVVLKRVINDNRREENLPAMQAVCPALAALGAEAAALVGLRLAGVDVITRDPAVPLAESGGVVLEVNAGPGLYYHYMKAGGRTPVAGMILERLVGEPRA